MTKGWEVAFTAAALAVAASPAWSGSAGFIRLSWGTCEPKVLIAGIPAVGPRLVTLVVSAKGVAARNVGYDIEFGVYGIASEYPFPDSWRFDDAGCQTQERMAYDATSVAADCPALLGAHPLYLSDVYYDPEFEVVWIRLTTKFDSVTPDSATRYTLWRVTFDLNHLDLVAPVEADSCESDWPVGIATHDAYLYDEDRAFPAFQVESLRDNEVWFFGEVESVPTRRTSWGRVKGLYR